VVEAPPVATDEPSELPEETPDATAVPIEVDTPAPDEPVAAATIDTGIVPVDGEPPVGGGETPPPVETAPPDDPAGSTVAPVETAEVMQAAASDVASGEVIAALPAGAVGAIGGPVAVASNGAIAFSSGGELVVVDPAVGVVTLGTGSGPIWRANGSALLYASADPTGSETATVWDPATGGTARVELPSDLPYRDVPAGWDQGRFFFQRAYLDGSGVVELYRGALDGSAEVIWSNAGSDAGAFDSRVERAIVAPDGRRLAFIAGGALYIGQVNDPGAAFQVIGAPVDFDWSPTSESLVANDGFSLSVYDANGAYLGATENGGGIAISGALWTNAGIIYATQGPDAAVRLIAPESLVG
jgi:hypothetical protein